MCHFPSDRYVYVATFRPEWLAMLMIFKEFTWIGICVTLLVSGIAWYFLGRLTREKLPHGVPQLCALNSFSLLITHATNNRPLLTPLRILFVALALFGMNITTIYSSKLIRVFTHPVLEDQIDTVEEIITSRMPVGELKYDKSNRTIFLFKKISFVIYLKIIEFDIKMDNFFLI